MGLYKKVFIVVLIILALLYIYGYHADTQAMILSIGECPPRFK